MIFEIIIAVYCFESVRGSYYWLKESNRRIRTMDRLGDILNERHSWETLAVALEKEVKENPVLYRKIPQTWFFRWYDKNY